MLAAVSANSMRHLIYILTIFISVHVFGQHNKFENRPSIKFILNNDSTITRPLFIQRTIAMVDSTAQWDTTNKILITPLTKEEVQILDSIAINDYIIEHFDIEYSFSNIPMKQIYSTQNIFTEPMKKIFKDTIGLKVSIINMQITEIKTKKVIKIKELKLI